MPRKAAGIAPAAIRHLKPGRYADGNGLYLLVRGPEAKFWIFRYVSPVTATRREAGIGPAAGKGAILLASARKQAAEWRGTIQAGRDPLVDREAEEKARKAEEQRAKAEAKTFREVTELYIAAHEAGWGNAKHRAQWVETLKTYAYPYMGNLRVADVQTAHVMAALEPIWATKTETATRLRGRIESVLDYAAAREWRGSANPARWRGHLAKLLLRPSKVRKVEHHAALPWREIGGFMGVLRAKGGLPARALELAILTAARSGEVLNARWGEFDLSGAVWTVPGERMKAGREHRVPLSDAAVAVLNKLLPMRDAGAGDWVFPGAREGRPLSNMAMEMLLRRLGRDDLTVHGFRSTFRDWAAEMTGYAGEVAEAALAHMTGDRVEAAYRRGDLFDKRRRLMDDWAAFCARPAAEGGSVTPIRAAG